MIRDSFLKAADRVDDVSAGDAPQPMRVVRATLDNRLAGSGDLVARALAILDQDTDEDRRSVLHDWRTLRANLRPGRPVSGRAQRPISSCSDAFSAMAQSVFCLSATSTFNALSRAFWSLQIERPSFFEGAGLQPVLQEDGKAIVDLFCIEYRKTDIGPYNEVGLTVRAKAPTDPIPANYVVHLPVTTAIANRAGREIWGYNKFVAAIDVISNGKTFSTVLRDTRRSTYRRA